MKKIKITNRSIAKVEKRLLKVLKEEYMNEGLYCYVENVEIFQMEGFFLTYTISYGREEKFHKRVKINVGNQNLNFIAGQFFQVLE